MNNQVASVFVGMSQVLMDVIFDDFDCEDEDDVRVRYRQDVVRIEDYVENVLT